MSRRQSRCTHQHHWQPQPKRAFSGSTCRFYYIYRVVQKKRHKVNDTIILQPYVIESCGFQQDVPKEILYMTKVSIWIQQLNILCYCRWQLNYAKTLLPLTLRSIKTCYFYFFNSSMKHWPISIIFGMLHYKETWRKCLQFWPTRPKVCLLYTSPSPRD